MFPIIFGFAAALAYATYGSVSLTDYGWVSMVSRGLIAGGIAVYALTHAMPAWLRRLGSRVSVLLDARLGLGNTEPLCA